MRPASIGGGQFLLCSWVQFSNSLGGDQNSLTCLAELLAGSPPYN